MGTPTHSRGQPFGIQIQASLGAARSERSCFALPVQGADPGEEPEAAAPSADVPARAQLQQAERRTLHLGPPCTDQDWSKFRGDLPGRPVSMPEALANGKPDGAKSRPAHAGERFSSPCLVAAVSLQKRSCASLSE